MICFVVAIIINALVEEDARYTVKELADISGWNSSAVFQSQI